MQSNSSAMELDSKRPFDISILMSPPEPIRFESFSQGVASKMLSPTVSELRQTHGPVPPLSPPISPATKADHEVTGILSPTTTPVKDPILYPTQDAASSPSQQPLFGDNNSVDTRQIVDSHVVARPAEFFRNAKPPQREDYELMLFFSSQVMKKYNENPKAWLQRERAFLLADRRAAAKNRQFKLQSILPAKPQPLRREVQRPKPAKLPRVTKQSQSGASLPRPIRAGPYPSSLHRPLPARAPSGTPDPSPRRTVAPNREDKDFQELPNFCPPQDSLPNKPNSLKVDWKGTPIDLGSDPHRHLLHPDEVMLAANLRLDCATYLTSKRRMFMRRLECLRVGKEFRKTDAQQACKIDVNKASKLWTAFDKVGWLEKHWVSRYL